jgi:hypothetical protein
LRALAAVAAAVIPRVDVNDAAALATRPAEKVRLLIAMRCTSLRSEKCNKKGG